ncbi:LysR family transcriptional regulator [Liquorilactobacillus uvarum]|uniref:LysR family transcriptional regulator n=1 Tax=Liquorilactobacillus uvarum DSM 19971 TaxID=1423812 RepID=A0A0R1Q3Z6_9LACO|nr:LysR family transcriptional regulator [Liquorilactobacillus uvarum]KRL36938.1 LysR family transcriptional regulator [Liquorilactobacillus uvarum DSM 19971]
MLNIWRLQLLVQLEKLGTMRLVAEVMLVSPATVSTQLRVLENETNTVLLEKVGRNVELTIAGQKLVKQVTPILNQLESVTNEIEDSSQRIQGTVRIVAFSSALQTIVIPAASQIKKQHPQINMTLTEMEPDQSMPALDSHQFDIAVIAYFGAENLGVNNDYKLIKLGTDHLQVLVGKDSPLSDNEDISINELKNQHWILEPQNAYLAGAVHKLCNNAGFKPNVLGICQSYTTLQKAVSCNLAVGILPTLAITEPLTQIKLLNFKPTTVRHIYLVIRKPQMSVRAIQVMVQAIQEQAARVFLPAER